MKFILFIISCLIIMMSFAYAVTIGDSDSKAVKVQPPEVPINYSLVPTVNSSYYWGNYLWTDYNMPLIKLYGGINYTTEIYNLYNAIWSTTFNFTYAQWAYNQTNPAILYANDTFIPYENATKNIDLNNKTVSEITNLSADILKMPTTTTFLYDALNGISQVKVKFLYGAYSVVQSDPEGAGWGGATEITGDDYTKFQYPDGISYDLFIENFGTANDFGGLMMEIQFPSDWEKDEIKRIAPLLRGYLSNIPSTRAYNSTIFIWDGGAWELVDSINATTYSSIIHLYDNPSIYFSNTNKVFLLYMNEIDPTAITGDFFLHLDYFDVGIVKDVNFQGNTFFNPLTVSGNVLFRDGRFEMEGSLIPFNDDEMQLGSTLKRLKSCNIINGYFNDRLLVGGAIDAYDVFSINASNLVSGGFEVTHNYIDFLMTSNGEYTQGQVFPILPDAETTTTLKKSVLTLPSGDGGFGMNIYNIHAETAFNYLDFFDPNTYTAGINHVVADVYGGGGTVNSEQTVNGNWIFTGIYGKESTVSTGNFVGNVEIDAGYFDGKVRMQNGYLNMTDGNITNVNNIVVVNSNITGNEQINGNLKILQNLSVKRPYWTGYDNSTQTMASTASAQVINISNNNDFDNYGIRVLGRQNLSFDQTGDYLCLLTPEFYQATGSNKVIQFWIQKNGVDVPFSNSQYTMTNGEYTAPLIPFQFDINNPSTDRIRFMWWSDSTSSQIVTLTGLTLPTRPSVPGVILNCQKVSELT